MKDDAMYPIGRALIGILFLVSGVNKIIGFFGVTGWMSSMGIPAAGVLLTLAIIIEVLGGIALITGMQAGVAAWVLAAFLIPVTLIFHGFWSANAADFQNQFAHFLKNVAIFGAMLGVFYVERQRSTVHAITQIRL